MTSLNHSNTADFILLTGTPESVFSKGLGTSEKFLLGVTVEVGDGAS